MRKSATLLSGVLLASLLFTACSNGGAQDSTSAAGTDSATQQPAALTSLFKAPDLSKLPATAQQRTDTIIMALTDPSGAFTPYFHQSGYDGNVSSLMFAPLVTTNDKGLPAPSLADSWELSKDQLTYTFHLKKDLKFSDGSPLTAEDVAFTWTILHDKAYDGDSLIPTLGIKGGQEYHEGKADHISGIKIIDPQTISVTIAKPNATALLTLGSDVLSKAYYGKDYRFGHLDYIKDLHLKPVGNGPYVLEKFIPGQEVRFTANPYYFQGEPKTKNFIYKTSEGDTWQYVETGEIDFASFSATQENIDKLKSLGFVNILPYTPSTYSFLQVNLEHQALQDKKVRQAIAYGLDRQSIYVDANQGAGQIANIPAPPISWAYTEDGINPYAYEPEKAGQLLDEAGWIPGADGIREKNGQKLTLHYLGSKSAQTDVFIAVAEENFKAIGIDFQPEVFADYNSLASKVEGGDYDLASFSTPMLTDPSDGLVQFLDGEIKGYDNPQFVKLYNEALATNDLDKRKQIYAELFKLLNDDLPVIFTNYKKIVYAYNGRINDLTVSPFNGIASSVPQWALK
ncbi:ABC transporter substrate-binding protein [Paenibacillus bovis]|uniref:ABC transporter substrate-binding protein n=1 Tax=Paenibacillus bovis TaxID=1616788 RepID=A0A172ZCQ1_9BACL|nr:ABC transporter substrate-binding protein [Paenibacillus bovis]ANF95431.1 ABC transporter substrate-binding protein [Paenibacillus bovis]